MILRGARQLRYFSKFMSARPPVRVVFIDAFPSSGND